MPCGSSGGAGCAVLLLLAAFAIGRCSCRSAWVAAACLVIAINGSRGLAAVFRPGVAGAGVCCRMGVDRDAVAGSTGAGSTLAGSSASAKATADKKDPAYDGGASRGDCAARDRGVARERVQQPRPRPHARHQLPDGPHVARRASRALRRSRVPEVLGARDVAARRDSCASRTAPEDPIYIFGFSGGAYVECGTAQCLALFLEPPGHRRLQRARNPATASPGSWRTSNAETRHRRAADARLGRRRQRLRRVLHGDAPRSATGYAPVTTASKGREGSRHGSADSPLTPLGTGISARSFVAVAGRDPRARRAGARALSGSGPAVESDGRRGVARRRGVDAQRTQQGALRRVDGWMTGTRSTSPPSSRRSSTCPSVRSASGSGRRGWCRKCSGGSPCCCSRWAWRGRRPPGRPHRRPRSSPPTTST